MGFLVAGFLSRLFFFVDDAGERYSRQSAMPMWRSSDRTARRQKSRASASRTPARVEAGRLLAPDATAANGSLTLLAVGSGDTESRLSGGEDVVGAQKIQSSGRRGATALPAGESSSARALHAAGPARISLPDHQYVAGWPVPAGARHRQCRRPR